MALLDNFLEKMVFLSLYRHKRNTRNRRKRMIIQGSKKRWICGVALWLMLIALPSAFAQTGGDGTTGSALSIREVVSSGGWVITSVVGLLGLLSILAVAFVLYFFVVLRTSQIAPPRFRRDLRELIVAGTPLEKARKLCEDHPCPLSAVGLSAMDYLHDVSDADPSLLKDIMEGEGARQSETIQGQTQYLMDIAVVSPMVGLLGTVFGMLSAFSSIALNIAQAKPVVLALGVSQALLTTAFGLIVGIPAMLFYAYFRRQSSKMVSHLESASTDILTALLSRRP